MAPHLTPQELDFVTAKRAMGKGPVEIHRMLEQKRARKGVKAPHLTSLRHVLKGHTYRRGMVETRGRKPRYTKRMILKMNKTRKDLIKEADGNREVRWKDVVKKARAPKADRSTVRRSFQREGIAVQARRPREKPDRTTPQKKARVRWCKDRRSPAQQ